MLICTYNIDLNMLMLLYFNGKTFMVISAQFCVYYQAQVVKDQCWFMAATLRSFEHLTFDRTIDAEKSIFEFFVPKDLEGYFLEIMEYYASIGLINNLVQLPNRLR